MSAVTEPRALLFSRLTLAQLHFQQAFCFKLVVVPKWVSVSAHIPHGVQVQRRNGCFLCAPAPGKRLPLRQIGSLWRKVTADAGSSGSATMTIADVMQMLHMAARDPQVNPGFTAGRFPGCDRSGAAASKHLIFRVLLRGEVSPCK